MRLRLTFLAAVFGARLLPCCGQSAGHVSKDETARSTPDGYCDTLTPALVGDAGDPETPLAPVTEEPVEGSACNAVIRTYPPAQGVVHVDVCDPVSYQMNPPVYGDHYAPYPRYGVYEYAVPRGFYVHTLEHGAIVLTYSCEDCAEEIAEAVALVKTLPVDPACCSDEGCGDAANRLLLTPDPGIPTRWAAAAWGYSLTADCYEPDVFEAFAEQYRGFGTETICDNVGAIDVTVPEH